MVFLEQLMVIQLMEKFYVLEPEDPSWKFAFELY
jgi:hypothetical protein